MRTLGRLSKGIGLGLETGFDSGTTLDYVYRNEARGITPLGKFIDRNYLDAIGWRGIRVRKTHLEQAIAAAASHLVQTGKPLRIFDPAAGHGRYVLETAAQLAHKPESIVLRDYVEHNVRSMAAMAQTLGLANITRTEHGDAFDAPGLATLLPKPTLCVVSGLYELFSDNQRVLASLRGLAQALNAGGYLVYTGQPWHPQLEFIARTLTTHRGHKPWLMRRRTQAELDELVAHAGFRKIDQWIDEWGIFTVSLAIRN
jgi:hypothetical protein